MEKLVVLFVFMTAVIFGAAVHGNTIQDVIEQSSLMVENVTFENYCIGVADVGVFRPPWFMDQATLDFETYGCCYNDSLQEPKGC